MSTRKDRDVMKRSVLADEQSSILSSLFVASLLVAAALLITASTSLAQNGLQVSVTHTTNPTPGSLVFDLSDDTNGKNSLFTNVDWSKWKIWMAGGPNPLGAYDITTTMLAVSNLSLNKDATQLTLGLPFAVPWLNFAMEACTVGPNSYCKNSFKLLHGGTCYPSTACTSHSIPYTMPVVGGHPKDFDVSAMPMTVQNTTVLAEFAAVGETDRPQKTDFNAYDWYLEVWKATSTTTALEEFDKNPIEGNYLKNYRISETHTPFNGKYYVKYHLPQHVVLTPGDYFIAVQHTFNNQMKWPVSFGFWSTTAKNLAVDYNAVYFFNRRDPAVPWTNYYTPGTMALDVYGY
jgi:hypothetical protein